MVLAVADLAAAMSADGRPVVWTTTRGGDAGAAAFVLNPDGTLTQIDAIALSGTTSAGAVPSLANISVAGSNLAMIAGTGSGSGLLLYEVDADGGLGAAVDLAGTATLPEGTVALATAEVGGAVCLFVLEPGAQSPTVLLLEENPPAGLRISQAVTGNREFLDGGAPAPGLTAMAMTMIGGQQILLAAGVGETSIQSYLVGPNGALTEVASEAVFDGPGIGDPSVVEMVIVDGTTYALIAGATSGTLSLYQVNADGTFALTDHVIDDLGTRFGGTTALATHTIDGRTFAVAAGNDMGLSLFEILPGGMIIHHGSIEDTVDMALTEITALTLTSVDGALQIIAAGGGTQGLTWLSVDLGGLGVSNTGSANSETLLGTPEADLLSAIGGNDYLYGGAGNDVLQDGSGVDRLTGGAGADVFVFGWDGGTDMILDFDPAEDRIDLSHWPFLRNLGQLAFHSRSFGAVITYGDEHLVIYTADGSPLTSEQLAAVVDFGPAHYHPNWLSFFDIEPDPQPPFDPTLYGTTGADTIIGGVGVDHLDGLGGNDSIQGKAGADAIQGGDGHDILAGNAGSDLILGGPGHDTIEGGIGWDDIFGGAGNDVINGNNGLDTLHGDLGDDVLFGNFGSDTLFGGDGNDSVEGGKGADLIYGGAGNDILSGSEGFDTLYGDAGNDSLFGNAGSDELFGGEGDDLFEGGIGADTLWGEAGDDILSGGSGSDRLFGGDGADIVEGNAGHDLVDGGAGNDLLYGGTQWDTIFGGIGDDFLSGGTGKDSLFGGSGHDELRGGRGDDTLAGGDGDDVLVGDDGADTFIFEDGGDHILDFEDNRDTILFDATLWGGGTLTPQQILSFASVGLEGVVFDFGAGGTLTLDGITSLNILIDDIGLM
ncbi:calcium-binding protein [Loktanella sp. IMCC34160]|uniref:calcium-binding protein n=1 Tax=Loktanella sp. IMCC34160 TaxID=2510646 RepID=UPI001A91581F|nr:calcium-binding protein [Loktanella sp. IMCC34160]